MAILSGTVTVSSESKVSAKNINSWIIFQNQQVKLIWTSKALSRTGIVIEFIHDKPSLPRQSK